MAVLPPKPAGLVIRQERDRGSYGAVYSGELDGKPVVVKRIHQLLLKAPNSDKLLRDFYRECRILSTVRHANVVRFIGAYCMGREDEGTATGDGGGQGESEGIPGEE